MGAGLDLGCGIQCKFLWDGFGNWVSGQQGSLTWKPFIKADGKLAIKIMLVVLQFFDSKTD